MARNSRTISKHKAKQFLFFLILASIFWVLTKFGREFTSSISAKIIYKNTPETAVLARENPDHVNFDLTANGFEMLFYKFKKPEIIVDVEKYFEEGKDVFEISQNELMKQVESNFNKYLEIKNLNPENLKVHLNPITTKKVPVKAQTNISFKNGFRHVSEYRIVPDSVVISGPEPRLKELDSVNTQTLVLKNVNKSIAESVGLLLPESEMSADPSEVLFEWQVSEFSQEKLTMAIEVINLPPGKELKLVPQRVLVSFDVAIKDFGKVNEEDFKVVCDYSKRNDEEGFMTAVLTKQPEAAVHIAIEPKKIEYYIFEK